MSKKVSSPASKAIEGSPDIEINGKPAVRVGDAFEAHPHERHLKEGSSSVWFNGKKAGRIGDAKRGGIYLHDSGKGYSHGCVEVDPQFFTDLREYMRKHRGGKLRLQTKYPSEDTVTNGSTGSGAGAYSRQNEIRFHQQNPKWDPRNDPNYDPRDE